MILNTIRRSKKNSWQLLVVGRKLWLVRVRSDDFDFVIRSSGDYDDVIRNSDMGTAFLRKCRSKLAVR